MARPSNRHTDAGFSDRERDEFLLGEAIPVRSGNVRMAQWDGELLYLSFADGSLYQYPCSEQVARAFARAPSKGGFLWDHYLFNGEKGERV